MYKKILIALCLSILNCNLFAVNLPFYVGTYNASWGVPNNDGIFYGELSTESKTVSELTLAAEAANPSYILIDGNMVFAVNEIEPGKVTSFEKDGKILKEVSNISSNGNNAVHITKSGNEIFIANYGDSAGASSGISIFSNNNGIFTYEDSKIYGQMQARSHAHSIYPITINDKKYVYSTDLGTDLIHVYENNNGILNEIQSLQLQKGAGPRHMTISTKNNKIYVANELDSTISILEINPDNGELSIIKSIPSYVGKLNVERNYPSEIMLAKQGKNLYVTNRGMNDITLFDVNQDGLLKYNSSYSTHGNWPRDMDISEDEDYMAVANQNSNDVTFFSINDNGGLSYLTSVKINNPVSIKFDSNKLIYSIS
ncbi:lactonase family protein [Allofrancisella inopinata]|uniref:Lactonase family protein n=1 Tax=Allofrancisella inopinata TaxID=1085647 RepID=A0AAE6YGK8_9GAMM|nr:beta-propeller fold lactonase family protein [Allofrancisella inopinata]QIV95390.1 lactonase family protein [Allofrancisella inopinata]